MNISREDLSTLIDNSTRIAEALERIADAVEQPPARAVLPSMETIKRCPDCNIPIRPGVLHDCPNH